MRYKWIAAASLSVLVLLPAIARGATPVPGGSPIHVNASAHGRHFQPLTAVFPDGGFVVVWTNGPASGGRTVIHARLFDASGNPKSGEFRLTEPAVGSQTADDLVADRSGSFLVAWSEQDPGKTANVFVRRFRRDGSPAGPRLQANAPNALDRAYSHLAVGADGAFAVAWAALDFDTYSFYDTVARRFKADGSPLGPEFLVDAGDPGIGDDILDSFPTGLALGPDGTLTVLFQESALPEGTNTFVTQYPKNGKSGGSVNVNFYGCCREEWVGSALAISPDGGLVTVWRQDEIVARRLSPRGDLLGSRFIVPKRIYGDDYGDEILPQVAALPDGGFVVTWLGPFADGSTDGNIYVYTRIFNADGTAASRDLRLSTVPVNAESAPVVAANRRGPVVVVWSQGAGQTDIYARLLTSP
jgi:hypothetical protein